VGRPILPAAILCPASEAQDALEDTNGAFGRGGAATPRNEKLHNSKTVRDPVEGRSIALPVEGRSMLGLYLNAHRAQEAIYRAFTFGREDDITSYRPGQVTIRLASFTPIAYRARLIPPSW
jgi:hypothetical protein